MLAWSHLTSLGSKVCGFSEPHQNNTMPPATPPFDFDHHKGDEIPTKHKEAIRQLYGFAKVPIKLLMTRRRQPTTEAEIEAMVLEEWDRIL